MTHSKIYADFQNIDDANRLRLTCAGTLQDLARHGIQLHEGLVLTFYSDDADDQGHPDELRVEGVVHYDQDGQCWVATIDWSAIRHASQEETQSAKSLLVGLTKCIYCLQDKANEFFKKTEHVFPQSFGLFKVNLTLNGVVCDECNQYFGNKLETDLARDTLEGMYRFEFDVKSPEEFKSVGKRSRLKREIAEGEFKGAHAYLEYSKEQDRIVLKPIPQVGFLKSNPSEYSYFLLDEVPYKADLDQKDFDLTHPKAIRILDCSQELAERILSEKGFTFRYGGEIEPSIGKDDDWLCKIEGEIDDTIRRAVAKIAFNYLTYWEGREFVLHRDFDAARRFIRYGEKCAYPLTLIEDKNILQDELKDKIRVGHIITVNYAMDRRTILSQVSIFNFLSYKVCLAREFSGPLRDIRRGHFFNIYNQEIWGLEAR